jgi:hypothetical protein
MISPHVYPELFSKIYLGDPGFASPGVVTLSGHDRNKNWDVQKAKGNKGASTKLNGDGPGTFQASFYLVDQEDFDAWDEFQKLIESSTAGPSPVALPIYHPDLVQNGFTEVVNAGIGGPSRDDRGGCTIQVKFTEYLPPRPAPTAKASGGYATSRVNERPDPNAAAKRELAGLLDEARKP